MDDSNASFTEVNEKLTLANDVSTHGYEQKVKCDDDLVMMTMIPGDNEIEMKSNFTVQACVTIFILPSNNY